MGSVIIFLGCWILVAAMICALLSRLINKAKRRDKKYFGSDSDE